MSESEEMYLLTIVQMCELGYETPISIGDLAEQLDVLPVSANQMVHKLAEAGWLEYVPYRGVNLTLEGQLIAQRVLHHRRLWEVFLVDHLGLSVDEADALACRLEHITPDKVSFQLAEFLGNPVVSPQGHQIPALPGSPAPPTRNTPLWEMKVGEQIRITHVPEGAAGTFLREAGVRVGQSVTVVGKADAGSILLELEGETIHLARQIADRIAVQSDETSCASCCSAYTLVHRN